MRAIPLIAAFLLVACTTRSASLPARDSAPAGDSPVETEPPDSDSPTLVDSLPIDIVDPAPESPWGPCADLYDPDQLQTFEVDISPSDLAALEADYASGTKSYHPITFTLGDDVVTDAMIRLKGNPTFSWNGDKMQFVIAFNEVDPEGRFQGLRKLSLDASWYEPTLVRDRLSWSLIHRQGELPWACANSATLTINGDYYGLFTNIEYFDHEWLERVFGDDSATGTLWKYGSDPVSNADASDGSALWAMAATTDPARLAELGDLEEWVTEWAAEVVLGDDDGYWCCDHNYYLYEHPSRGILFLPWDLDDTFEAQAYDTHPIEGYYPGLFQQPHFRALVNDPTWGPVFVDKVAALNEAMDPALVVSEIDAIDAQIADALEADPHRTIGWDEHVETLERTRAWVPARHAFLQSWVACERGERTDADDDGYDVCQDFDDTDPTIHPGATETCNGLDDDCDGWIDDQPECEDCERHDFEDRHLLFCRWPRSAAEAQSHCEAHGGTLTSARTTAEYYMFYFYTWPVFEPWWTGTSSGARCPAWDEASFSSTSVTCTELHPSVCALP